MNDNVFLSPIRSGTYYLPGERQSAIVTAADAAGLKTQTAPIGNLTKMGEVLRELGRHLGFPEWYGANLDALHDCLTDPDCQSSNGHVIVISGLSSLQAADPEGFSVLLDVFRSACEVSQDAGPPLWVIVDTPAADLPILQAP